MSDRLKQLREKRAKIVADMRALHDKAGADKRDLTDEEVGEHDRLFGEQDKLRGQIQSEERQAELDREMAARHAEDEAKRGKGKEQTKEQREMALFRQYLSGDPEAARGALRSLQAGSDTEGGYLRPPMEFLRELIQAVDDAVFVRRGARKFEVTQSASLGVPTLDTDLDDADWTTELQTGNEDTAMRLGRRELTPHPLAKRLKVSKKLLRSSALPIEGIINQRIAYKLGVTEEKAFLTGSGQQRPLGVFTASSDGVPTSRDVSTGNTTTSITFDGLIECKYSVKAAYWPRASWTFHRDAIKQLVKLKDGEGQYIWRESVRAGEPDTLLGRPIDISEFAPNTFTTGLYVGLFCDWSFYWIVDALDLTIQRLIELYAETNQDGFIIRAETDGMPVLAEAFARVKLA